MCGGTPCRGASSYTIRNRPLLPWCSTAHYRYPTPPSWCSTVHYHYPPPLSWCSTAHYRYPPPLSWCSTAHYRYPPPLSWCSISHHSYSPPLSRCFTVHYPTSAATIMIASPYTIVTRRHYLVPTDTMRIHFTTY